MKSAIVTIGVLSLDIVEIKRPIEEMVSTVETAKVLLDHKSTNLVKYFMIFFLYLVKIRNL